MDKEVNKSSRRGLLFGAAATGTAAAAILVLPKMAHEDAVVETPKPVPEKGGGYSLTAHVKQYYSTTLI